MKLICALVALPDDVHVLPQVASFITYRLPDGNIQQSVLGLIEITGDQEGIEEKVFNYTHELLEMHRDYLESNIVKAK